ncbi:MAG: DUF234 domain-containing protein [Methanosarcinaceae archaeon]|nr:DUF234 domain-containing protein [Methanosarcinaceae archaeon]
MSSVENEIVYHPIPEYFSAGKWWFKREEIDVVAVNEGRKGSYYLIGKNIAGKKTAGPGPSCVLSQRPGRHFSVIGRQYPKSKRSMFLGKAPLSLKTQRSGTLSGSTVYVPVHK